MKNISFSVIVPLYNKEKYIKRTINSILNQTYRNFEIIVVNDGSTDNSLSIVKSIKDKRIKIYSRKHEGVSCARNFGIKKATGEYIAFLDADDKWDKNFLQEILRLQHKYPKFKFFATAYKIMYSDNKKDRNLEVRMLPYKREVFVVKNYLKLIAENNFFMHIGAVVIKKDVFKETGFFLPTKPIKKNEVVLFENFNLYLRILEKYKIVYSRKVLCVYQKNKNTSISLETKNDIVMKYEFFEKQLFHYLKNSSALQQKYIKTILYRMYKHMISHYLVKKQYNKIFRFIPRLKKLGIDNITKIIGNLISK
jgi:glycosyltransferase involved in cell wall biosynthesis